MKYLLSLLLIVSLFGCTSSSQSNSFTEEENYLFIGGPFHVEMLDLTSLQSSVFDIKNFMQSIHFDPIKKELVAPVYSPEDRLLGLTYCTLDGSKITKETKPFAPIHIYQYNNIYLMDSAQAIRVNGVTATQLGFYDSMNNQMLETFQIPGRVKDIIGKGSKAYVSSYHAPQEAKLQGVSSESNIYEVDLETKTTRPIFSEYKDFAPHKLMLSNGNLYGIYKSAQDVPVQEKKSVLVKIDIASGQILQEILLPPFALSFTISSDGNTAFVTHYDDIKYTMVESPLSRINLKTSEVQKISGDFQARAIIRKKDSIYIADQQSNTMILLDPKGENVEKIIPLQVAPLYLR